MTTATATKNEAPCFRFKGNLFTLTVLQLLNNDETAFHHQLQQTIKQAPKFFQHAPIVIDLNDFQTNASPLDLAKISEQLRAHSLIPVGIRGGDSSAQTQAQEAGLAIMANSQQNNASKTTEKSRADKTSLKKSPPPSHATKVITQPIRSGQQIYAKGCDLIVLSSVSPGAEILADGHIHVYGPLRGRALAGILGNKEARIFCKSLESELVSIAGRYLVSEQLAEYKNKGSLHIYLENDQLMFSNI